MWRQRRRRDAVLSAMQRATNSRGSDRERSSGGRKRGDYDAVSRNSCGDGGGDSVAAGLALLADRGSGGGWPHFDGNASGIGIVGGGFSFRTALPTPLGRR